jgi:hypothetical protein
MWVSAFHREKSDKYFKTLFHPTLHVQIREIQHLARKDLIELE